MFCSECCSVINHLKCDPFLFLACVRLAFSGSVLIFAISSPCPSCECSFLCHLLSIFQDFFMLVDPSMASFLVFQYYCGLMFPYNSFFLSNVKDLGMKRERDKGVRSATEIKSLETVLNCDSIFSLTQNEVGKMGSMFCLKKKSLCDWVFCWYSPILDNLSRMSSVQFLPFLT